MRLHLPGVLVQALWQHAERETPRECVGALGGLWTECALGAGALARAAYPLPNIAACPEQEYLADPGALLRALRAMQAEMFSLVGLYHSHPTGPARPSLTDERLAVYPVPYVIADLPSRTLRAYLLPTGEEVGLTHVTEPCSRAVLRMTLCGETRSTSLHSPSCSLLCTRCLGQNSAHEDA